MQKERRKGGREERREEKKRKEEKRKKGKRSLFPSYSLLGHPVCYVLFAGFPH
jgi:hypothetical protein